MLNLEWTSQGWCGGFMSWLALSKMATHSSAPAKHQLEIPTASTPTRKENNMNSSTYMYMYPSIAGNYQGRELNFTVWALATREIFSMKFGHATPAYYDWFSHSAKGFFTKRSLPANQREFSPSKVSCRTIIIIGIQFPYYNIFQQT